MLGSNVPKEFIPGVEKGIKQIMETGVVAGYPMIDFKATLIDGAYHDVDTRGFVFVLTEGGGGGGGYV